jgi:hypothetical protein
MTAIAGAWLFAAAVLVGLPSVALAETSTRPFWTEQAMFRFGDELFFTGRASCAPTVEDGRQRAYEAAVQEVINYTRTTQLTGVHVETQMIFEEHPAAGCPPGTVTIWRLLRLPEIPLNALAARAHQTSPGLHLGPGSSTKDVRDLTLRPGMSRQEIWDRFGQPRSVTMRRDSREIHYDYPQFGLVLAVNDQGFLLHWHLAAPESATASRPPQFDWPKHGGTAPVRTGADEEPAIDLTDRLRALQDRTKQELQEDARAICSRRWPRDVGVQRTCEPYEYEYLRQLELQRKR